jgi:hypothetical protein
MGLEQSIESLAEKVGVEIETFADEEYQSFLTATKPLFDDLKAFAESTGKADLTTLLNDVKADLVTGVTRRRLSPPIGDALNNQRPKADLRQHRCCARSLQHCALCRAGSRSFVPPSHPAGHRIPTHESIR